MTFITIASLSFFSSVPALLSAPNNHIEAWSLLCDKSNTNCKAYTYIKTDKNIIASTLVIRNIKIQNSSKNSLIGILMLPLGFHVPSGIKIQVDDSLSFNAKLLECKRKGCRAIFNANAKILKKLKSGKTINIMLVDSNSRKSLILTYSLKGFSKVYKTLAAAK